MFKFLEGRENLASLLIRLSLAALFLFTGISKIMNYASTKLLVANVGFESWIAFWAVLLILTEISLGALLFLGLFTRVAGAWGVILMVIILVVYNFKNLNNPMGITDMFKNIVILFSSLSVVFSGPGKYSLDYALVWE